MNPEELKKLRGRLDLTQAQLAAALGVTWNTVARWEIGQRQIPELAVRLLKYLARDARALERARKG